MKIGIYMLIGFVLGMGSASLVLAKKDRAGQVLAEEVMEATPSPTPSPVPLAVTLYTSQEIYELVEKFAAEYGVSPHVLRHVAVCESGFNPEAVNGPHGGLYQFGSVTWEKYRGKMGEDADSRLRFDAQAAVKTAAYVFSLDSQGIWPNCLPEEAR